MNETMVTVVGNLVDDPRLRSIDGGTEVSSFRVASTSRRRDRDSGQWVDSGQLFLSVSCWRALAANATASLRKGDPVLVTGRLTTRTYEKDGQNRTVCELEAYAIGPDLSRGTSVFRRAPRPVAEESGPYEGGAGRGGAGERPAEAPEAARELVGAGM